MMCFLNTTLAGVELESLACEADALTPRPNLCIVVVEIHCCCCCNLDRFVPMQNILLPPCYGGPNSSLDKDHHSDKYHQLVHRRPGT